MKQERRNHPRLSFDTIKAHITIKQQAQGDDIEIDGHIIDISYTGIKICLNSPLPETYEGRLKIVLILPESKIPLTIHGEIKHIDSDFNYGMQYIDNALEEKLDPLLFECIKFSKAHHNANDYIKTYAVNQRA